MNQSVLLCAICWTFCVYNLFGTKANHVNEQLHFVWNSERTWSSNLSTLILRTKVRSRTMKTKHMRKHCSLHTFCCTFVYYACPTTWECWLYSLLSLRSYAISCRYWLCDFLKNNNSFSCFGRLYSYPNYTQTKTHLHSDWFC